MFPQFWFLDIIGRISFPIFAFTTAVGFMYTRNVPRYGLRLFACAVISEPFFDLALFGTPFYLGRQNVLFTLALGVLMLYLWLCFDNLVFQCLSLLMVLLAAEMFRVDYSSMGLLMILFFYCFYNENLKRDLTVAAVNVLLMGRSQMLLFWLWSHPPVPRRKGQGYESSILSVLSVAFGYPGRHSVDHRSVRREVDQ